MRFIYVLCKKSNGFRYYKSTATDVNQRVAALRGEGRRASE